MKEKVALALFGSFVGIGGFLWLFLVEWKIALCAVLMIWGNNIVQESKYGK